MLTVLKLPEVMPALLDKACSSAGCTVVSSQKQLCALLLGEYVPGLSWTEWMDSGKKLDEEEAQETRIKQGNKETKYLAHSAVGEMQK